MKWFLVKYIYQIVSGEGNYNPQFDEQLRLMLADSAADAIKKAEAQAENFQPPFKNCMDEVVAWNFIGVADLHEIQMPEDGAEVSSTIHEPNDVVAFLDMVEQHKLFLQQQILCENETIEIP